MSVIAGETSYLQQAVRHIRCAVGCVEILLWKGKKEAKRQKEHTGWST